MSSLEDQVAQLTLQIQALQNQLSAQTMSLPVDPPPPPTMTKLPKITAPTPFTGLQLVLPDKGMIDKHSHCA